MLCCRFLIACLLLLPPTFAAASDAKPALRVLRDQCLGCHKPGKAKGGLLLTTREKMLLGGDSGAAVVPGKVDDSLLCQLIAADGDPHMPPKKQLSDPDQAALRAWVQSGAAWDAAVFDELPSAKPMVLSDPPAAYEPVLSLAIAPDQTRIAVARGNRIAILDLSKSGYPVMGILSGALAPVQSVAWSPDGKSILSGDFRAVRIWDAATLTQSAVVAAPLVGQITALAVSKDGQTVFAADGDIGGVGFIHRISVRDAKVAATWKAHDDSIYALRLSPDGKLLASGSADKLARIWNVADGKLVTTYEGHTNHIVAVAFNQDATQLATAGADREVKVWDVKSAEQEVSLGDKKIAFTGLDWTPDGKSLVAVTDKGSGAIYSELKPHTGDQRSETGKTTKLAPVKGMLYTVAVTADGRKIFAGGDDGRVYLWNESGKDAGIIDPGS